MKTCVFAGTFDPITKGHEYVINKCLEMFDEIIVAVGVNVDKKPVFTVEQRVEMITLAFKGNERVKVKTFSGMLVDFMKENGVKINVRGIRDVDDYKYETTMSRYNQDGYSDIITVYLPTPTSLEYVSSSGVRNLLSLNADYSAYVSKAVKEYADKVLKKI